MFNLILQAIRFVAVLPLGQLMSMLFGWSMYSNSAQL